MKGAILAAGSIVTVSESYAWEITRPAHGVGLHTILAQRSADLTGIVNGMDTSSWDPSVDPHIHATYSVSNLAGKSACKRELRRKLGLPEAEYGVDVPLVAFIGRLDPQKGSDIILSALSGLLALDCQVCARPSASTPPAWPRRRRGWAPTCHSNAGPCYGIESSCSAQWMCSEWSFPAGAEGACVPAASVVA